MSPRELGYPWTSLPTDATSTSLETQPLGPPFLYNKDPNAGIHAVERLDRQTGKIERILGGRLYQADNMAELAPNPGPEPKVWWRSPQNF